MRTVFVRGLRLAAQIGLWQHERGRSQPLVVDVAVAVDDAGAAPRRLDDVVRYDLIVADIQELVAAGHIDLVESLADQIADRCAALPRVAGVWVRVAKTTAVPDADAVGVEVRRGAAPPVTLGP